MLSAQTETPQQSSLYAHPYFPNGWRCVDSAGHQQRVARHRQDWLCGVWAPANTCTSCTRAMKFCMRTGTTTRRAEDPAFAAVCWVGALRGDVVCSNRNSSTVESVCPPLLSKRMAMC